MGPPSWPVAFSTTASLLEMLTAGMGLGWCWCCWYWLWGDGTASSSAPTHRRHRKTANRKWTLSAGDTNTHTRAHPLWHYSGRCFYFAFEILLFQESGGSPRIFTCQPSTSRCVAQPARTRQQHNNESEKERKKDAANLPDSRAPHPSNHRNFTLRKSSQFAHFRFPLFRLRAHTIRQKSHNHHWKKHKH